MTTSTTARARLGRFSARLSPSLDTVVAALAAAGLHVDVARALTALTGLQDLVTYRFADATDLPYDDASFGHAWMLDVGIHVRDKATLFGEIARVLQPGGCSSCTT